MLVDKAIIALLSILSAMLLRSFSTTLPVLFTDEVNATFCQSPCLPGLRDDYFFTASDIRKLLFVQLMTFLPSVNSSEGDFIVHSELCFGQRLELHIVLVFIVSLQEIKRPKPTKGH